MGRSNPRKKGKSLGVCPVCKVSVKVGIRKTKDGVRRYYHRSCYRRA